MDLVSEIYSRLRTVLPERDAPIQLHEPYFTGNEWKYVEDCITSGWVSSAGTYVSRFEEMLADITGAGRAVAVMNGTAALYMCLKLAGIAEGSEVLLPTLSFVATANAVSYQRAVPHFVDSDEKTLGIDPVKLKKYLEDIVEERSGGCINRLTGRPISALLPMHTFGHPADMDLLLEICKTYGLVMVEDAAQSLGSLYRGKHMGHFGTLGALSFNGNKIVTTGGGGAILTDDGDLGALAKHLTTTAKLPHPWSFSHDMLGYNHRMPNINAALGCAQLERLDEYVDRKRTLAKKYQEAFDGLEGVTLFTEQSFVRSNYWLNALILADEHAAKRDEILESTTQNGIVTRPVWDLLHTLPMYRDCPRMDLSTAESLARRVINIPSSVFLS